MKISELLINWYVDNHRELPWRQTRDAYRIWLSEIMLQQTRVDQAMPYYLRFIEHYPTVSDMALAPEQEILSLWQGLGYYSRARNMHAAARYIHEHLNDEFPSTFDTILELKGVGRYTASAIASFAYDLPHPVIDGNVNRVITRLFNIEHPIDRRQGQQEIEVAVESIFDADRPAIFNQAIMELGALVCTPKNPDCNTCPLQTQCLSKSKGVHLERPVKAGRIKVKEVTFHYIVIHYGSATYIEKRSSGIWQNLHQFPLIEKEDLTLEDLQSISPDLSHLNTPDLTTTHLLSHRRITANFYTITCAQRPNFSKSDIFEIELDALGKDYPIPNLIRKYLQHKKEHDQ